MRKRCPKCNSVNDPSYKDVRGIFFTIKNVPYYSCSCGYEWIPYSSQFRLDKINNNFKLPEYVTLVSDLDINTTQTDILEFNDSRYGNFKSYFKALKDAGWVSVHPQAVIERRLKTLESMKDQMKEARKKTMLERYGVEHQSQSKELLERQKAGILANKEKTMLKTKESLKNKYGVENPMHLNSVKEKYKQNIINKYGVDNIAKAQEVKAKISEKLKETLSDVDRYKNDEQYLVLPNGENLTHYAKKFGIEHPTHARKIFNEISPEVAQEYIESYNKELSLRKTDLELKAIELFKDLPIEYWNKNVIGKYRPDFKLNETTYLEVDGLIYHSNFSNKSPNHHLKKREEFEKQGLQILQFYQDEIVFKGEIVKSVIRNKLGLIEKKLYARQLTLKTVPQNEAFVFLNENHLMGEASGTNIGLYNGDELVSLMVYRKTKEIVDITRFCSKLNTIIVGGLSKLIKEVIRRTNPKEIDYYVDLRYGNGKSVEKLGFRLAGVTLGFRWTDKVYTYNRRYCRANMDERKLSESEYAKEMGLYKIYDAGQAKFKLTLK